MGLVRLSCQNRQHPLLISTTHPSASPSEPPPIPPNSTPAPPHQSRPQSLPTPPQRHPSPPPAPPLLASLGRCASSVGAPAARPLAMRLAVYPDYTNVISWREGARPTRRGRVGGIVRGVHPRTPLRLLYPRMPLNTLAVSRSRLTPADYRGPCIRSGLRRSCQF